MECGFDLAQILQQVVLSFPEDTSYSEVLRPLVFDTAQFASHTEGVEPASPELEGMLERLNAEVKALARGLP
jgi:hypothetical protein